MTDNENAQADLNEREILNRNDGADPCLAWLVGFSEKGLEMSVVLSVRGQFISGRLIGGRKFFEGIAEMMRGATSNRDDGIQDVMAQNFLEWQDLYPEADKIPEDHIARPAFIHLSNAKVRKGDRAYDIPFFRCKLASVDGFAPGGGEIVE